MGRLFEILPAVIAWGTLLLPLILFPVFPVGVTVFIVLYVFLWFLRAIEYGFFLVYSYYKYKKALKTNWKQELRTVSRSAGMLPSEVIHLVIMPTYKEPYEVLKTSITSLADSQFPLEQVFFCLATEERDQKRGRMNAQKLQRDFKDTFGAFYTVEHPKDLPDEIAGKGANITYAAQHVSEDLKKNGIKFRQVLVTTIDADNRIHPDLFSALTKEYCIDSERHQKSFQPIPLFFNNIWDVPVINRIVAISSSFWHLIEAGRPDRLRNFSSHSQPLSALSEMDFWDKTTIVEDGRQYWRSYLHFGGRYDVTPIFLPIYQDAIIGKTFFRSLFGQFQQLRRWAWGASDISYLTLGIWNTKTRLPVLKTGLQYFRLLEGHYMWATAALFLGLSTGGLPWMYSDFIATTIFWHHSAVLFSQLFFYAIGGIFVSLLLTFLLLPSPPNQYRRAGLLWQWIFFPLTTVFFGCLPALLTQTQLAFGIKMKFNVTEKITCKKSKKTEE